jgi:hypothetical protein
MFFDEDGIGLRLVCLYNGQFEDKMGRRVLRPLVLNRPLAAAIGVLVLGIADPAIGGEARRGETAVTCTNPYSGATFKITIDYDRGTVDNDPARISDSQISWRAASDGGNYTLDRKTGNLTVVVASSTGGSFLYDRCKLEN